MLGDAAFLLLIGQGVDKGVWGQGVWGHRHLWSLVVFGGQGVAYIHTKGVMHKALCAEATPVAAFAFAVP